MLIVTRLLQGCFGALLVPGALAIINTNFSARERGKAIGSWSAWLSIAPAVGPLLGGYVLQIASWRWIFFINLPLVIACYLMAVPGFKESRDENPRRVDIPGALLAMLSLGGITYGLIEGPARHWNAQALVPLVLGTILGAVFIYVEQHASDPMVELSVFKSRNFTASNLMTFGLYGALGGFLFAFVIYLQTRMHYSAVKAGASSLPIPFMLFFLSSWMGEKANKYGPRLFMTAGPLLVGLGMLLLLPLSPGDSYVLGVLPGILLFALGLSTTVAPLTVTVMSSVNERLSGIASGINNAVSRVSGLLVIAVLGVFGTENVYRFALILSTLLAVSAGITSFLFVQNRAVVEPASKPVR
jgi:MFS family permease